MFFGYEEDGWQDTAVKDIRYPAVKIGKAKTSKVAVAGALGEASAAAARGDTATPTKAHDKNTKDSKADKGGRSGKKQEVVYNKGPYFAQIIVRPLFFTFCTSLFYMVHIFISNLVTFCWYK
jgi:hypothetical protein